jgi:hypothetical protein
MPTHRVETYLKELRDIRSTGGGSPEISYYGPLETLLNEVGKKLKPRVRCVHNLTDTGAGFPDYGLYTTNQFQKAKDAEPLPGQPPVRGVICAQIRMLKGISRSPLTAGPEPRSTNNQHRPIILADDFRPIGIVQLAVGL